ncbi:MAG TPA: PIN domain-containing protein [Steroidobacteraceae bacterium]|nr:PIN domain-containing protein [Steroidobacteraceae bacterium]
MILLDTGPIVALFDPADDSHRPCVDVLKSIVEPLGTTIPVLTEAFHLLSPGSVGAANLIHFIADGGLTLWFLDPETMDRSFELMQQYADQPMDLADASLVAMAEAENLHKVFTIDRRDFTTYRIKRGHRLRTFELIMPARTRK